jgi:hypothetical protein
MYIEMSCVYTIEVNGKFYVGSCKEEQKRLWRHNTDFKTLNTTLYIAIRANNNEFIFKVHHYYEGAELRQEEQKLIDELHPELNENRAYNSEEDNKNYDKKYYQEHKDNHSKKNKIWRETHKEENKEGDKIYRNTHITEIAEGKKKWYESHKKEILEKSKENYQIIREQRLEKNKEKMTCDCGCIITKCNYIRHCLSKKHIKINK